MKIIVKHSGGDRTEIHKASMSCVWESVAGITFTDSEVERMIASYKRDGASVKKNKCSITIDATNI